MKNEPILHEFGFYKDYDVRFFFTLVCSPVVRRLLPFCVDNIFYFSERMCVPYETPIVSQQSAGFST